MPILRRRRVPFFAWLALVAAAIGGTVYYFAWREHEAIYGRRDPDTVVPTRATAQRMREANGLDVCLDEAFERRRKCWSWQVDCREQAFVFALGCVDSSDNTERDCKDVPAQDDESVDQFVERQATRHDLPAKAAGEVLLPLFMHCFAYRQGEEMRKAASDAGTKVHESQTTNDRTATSPSPPAISVEVRAPGAPGDDQRRLQGLRARLKQCARANSTFGEHTFMVHVDPRGEVVKVDAAPEVACERSVLLRCTFDPGESHVMRVDITTRELRD